MIALLNHFIPLLVGISSGLIYGYSFVLQQRSIFFHANKMRAISLFALRILLLCMVGSYLLRSPVIPSILVAVGFAIFFWSVILMQKAKLDERH